MKIKITALDKLFSTIIRTRANWRCERCFRSGRIECAHYHGRGMKSVRFDMENAAGLCFLCHQYFHAHPYEAVDWFKKRLGEKRYDLLMIRAHTPKKPDYELIKIQLTEELKNLNAHLEFKED